MIARSFVFLASFIIGISAALLPGCFERMPRQADPPPAAVDHSRHPSMDERTAPNRGTGTASCGLRRDPLKEDLPGDRVKMIPIEPTAARPTGPRVAVPLKVTYKHKAEYTAEARENGIEGSVTLRVAFLASGGIGSITTIKGLPFGLTERAIEAARKLRFEPEKVDGRPRTTTRPVSFTFNIY